MEGYHGAKDIGVLGRIGVRGGKESRERSCQEVPGRSVGEEVRTEERTSSNTPQLKPRASSFQVIFILENDVQLPEITNAIYDKFNCELVGGGVNVVRIYGWRDETV